MRLAALHALALHAFLPNEGDIRCASEGKNHVGAADRVAQIVIEDPDAVPVDADRISKTAPVSDHGLIARLTEGPGDSGAVSSAEIHKPLAITKDPDSGGTGISPVARNREVSGLAEGEGGVG